MIIYFGHENWYMVAPVSSREKMEMPSDDDADCDDDALDIMRLYDEFARVTNTSNITKMSTSVGRCSQPKTRTTCSMLPSTPASRKGE